MKKTILMTLTLVFSFAGTLNAEVREQNRLTEPLLLESNLRHVDEACKKNIIEQVYIYLVNNKADLERPSKASFENSCATTGVKSCFKSSSVNMYEVGSSLIYRGSPYVAEIGPISSFVFPQHPDIPAYEYLRADVVSQDCKISNIRLYSEFLPSHGQNY